MKILILPDVHNRWELAEKTIKAVKPDQTVFLGDYFDDFGDDPHSIADTADWFHHSVNQKDRIHICGNHDIHYWFADCTRVRCSGYDQFKSIAINDLVTPKDWQKLVFYHVLDNKWLLSHGGVHPFWFSPDKFKPGEIHEYSLAQVTAKLKRDSFQFLKAAGRCEHHWFYTSGFARGPSPYYGGLLWCDWNKEFHPIRGVNQIVGHTPNYELSWTIIGEGESEFTSLPLTVGVQDWNLTEKSSFNLCLDSQPGSRYFAIYEDGKLSVLENPHYVDHRTRRID